MDKFEARKKYRSLRDKLSEDDLLDSSVKIANNCLNLDIWEYHNYHVFLSIEKNKEIDTNPIINIINGRQKQVIISKSNFKDYSLTNYILDDDVILELNKYGIPEPKNGKKIKNNLIDVVFVPLLSYDKKGSRVGYGKGFYDRFLSNLSIKTIKIGLSLYEPENYIEGIDENDIKIDYCDNSKSTVSSLGAKTVIISITKFPVL